MICRIRKIGVKTVLGGNGARHSPEDHHAIRRSQRTGTVEKDQVLPRALGVEGALGLDPHLLQCQADGPAHIFSPILRGNVQIPGTVAGILRGQPVLVQPEQGEFHQGVEQ